MGEDGENHPSVPFLRGDWFYVHRCSFLSGKKKDSFYCKQALSPYLCSGRENPSLVGCSVSQGYHKAYKGRD